MDKKYEKRVLNNSKLLVTLTQECRKNNFFNIYDIFDNIQIKKKHPIGNFDIYIDLS